uniref:Uncharacterized protein n=1 Tax=Daphnia magna TaxID=35525 RepID=A0A0P6INQ7_9CRUS
MRDNTGGVQREKVHEGKERRTFIALRPPHVQHLSSLFSRQSHGIPHYSRSQSPKLVAKTSAKEFKQNKIKG